MGIITASNTQGTGAKAITETTLTASDTFTYVTGGKQYLILRNDSAGALTPNIDGAGGTTVPVGGLGDVDVSGGLTLASIAVGDSVVIKTETISKYLQGVITITGATDMTAQLLEY